MVQPLWKTGSFLVNRNSAPMYLLKRKKILSIKDLYKNFYGCFIYKSQKLYRIMARFNALGINLEKLESRPKPGSDFEFMFYFDIGASIYNPDLFELICELDDDLDGFRYFGSYTEIM